MYLPRYCKLHGRTLVAEPPLKAVSVFATAGIEDAPAQTLVCVPEKRGVKGTACEERAVARADTPFLGVTRRASAVQPPDRNIENTRKANPRRERHEAPRSQPIEPMERDDSRENDQKLRNDVDHAQQWIVGAKKHPRPSCIERELDEEQGQRQSTRSRSLR